MHLIQFSEQAARSNKISKVVLFLFSLTTAAYSISDYYFNSWNLIDMQDSSFRRFGPGVVVLIEGSLNRSVDFLLVALVTYLICLARSRLIGSSKIPFPGAINFTMLCCIGDVILLPVYLTILTTMKNYTAYENAVVLFGICYLGYICFITARFVFSMKAYYVPILMLIYIAALGLRYIALSAALKVFE